MSFGFPEITESFLAGQDILYQQFNDIDFYVEDENQENFYYTSLKKILPNIRIEKIFPLNGKPNVIAESALNIGNKRKVYIVDKDFDDILGKKIIRANLFYLERYSIENYVLETDAIINTIIEERPRLSGIVIERNFNLNDFLFEGCNLFKELCCVFLTIQKHELGIENVKCKPDRFFIFNPVSQVRNLPYTSYKTAVETALRLKDRRLSLNGQIKSFKKYFKKTINAVDCIANFPGKYLLKFLKLRIESLFRIPQINMESFTYRLMKNCTSTSLEFLRRAIITYIA